MSVPAHRRAPNKLTALVKARELASYTLKITQNQNTFQPKNGTVVRDKVQSCAADIFLLASDANDINVSKNPDLLEKRQELQKEALYKCKALKNLISLAGITYHLRDRRIAYWTSLVEETYALLRKWYLADCNRYGAPLTQENVVGVSKKSNANDIRASSYEDNSPF